MANIATGLAKKLVERICDRVKSDAAKAWIYSVYYITTCASTVTLAIVFGSEILGTVVGFLLGAG